MHHLHINHLWINGLLAAFDRLGLDARRLTQGLPHFRDGRIREGARLDLVDARSLWHRAASLSGDPLLGYRAGRMLSPRSLGVLLPIILHSPTLRQAVAHVVEFQLLISENGKFQIGWGGDCANARLEFEYLPAASSVPVHPQQVMSVIGSTLQTLGGVTCSDMAPAWLRVPPTMDCAALSSALNCEVSTNPGNIVFALDHLALDDAIIGRDDYLYETTLAYARTLLRAKVDGQTFLQQIKREIDTDFPARACLETVASALGIHRRALQRYLADQQTNFRALKEQVLKERAVKLLMIERADIADLPERLGYSDPSTFHRAFKSWFRTTPKQFRNQSAIPEHD